MASSSRISADEAHAIRKDFLRTGNDGRSVIMEKLAAAPPSWDAANRTARFVMTSQAKDRYGDIIVTAGMDTTEFEKNPQAFLNHRSANFSIGHWSNLHKVRSNPPRMEGDLTLHKSGGPIREVEQAHWMIENGYMRAASVGFIPDWREIDKVLNDAGEWDGGLQFNKSELIECSLVGVPANPQALAKALQSGAAYTREVIDYALDHFARDADGALIERQQFEQAFRVIRRGEFSADDIARMLGELDPAAAIAVCERFLSAHNKVAISRERLTAFERTERRLRLNDKRQREIEAIRLRGR